MSVELINPFPLNITNKVDSWEKLQQLVNIDPTLKIEAAEINKILLALKYLYTIQGGGDGGISANVPANFKSVIVDFDAEGSFHAKVLAAANDMTNYPIAPGTLQIIYTNRIVLTNGIGLSTGIEDAPSYTVISEYFVITQTLLPDANGNISIGDGGTPLLANHLRFFNTIDTRSYAPTEFNLGDIVAVDVWDNVNGEGPFSTPNGATILFLAKQNGVDKIWLYIGEQEEVGSGKPPTNANDYRLFDSESTDPPPPYQETLPTGDYFDIALNNFRLDNHEGRNSYMGSANDAVSYTFSNLLISGKEKALINAPSQPKITALNATNAGSFESKEYTIKTVGTTNFMAIGASANTVGVIFNSTGLGTGTGTATENAIQVGGNPFIANTDMYLKVKFNGKRVECKYEDFRQKKFPTVTPNTGTEVDLSNPFIDFKTNVANSATAYNIGPIVVDGGCEERLVNAASEPTVTGATKIKGSDFIVSTNMNMVTWNNGTRNEYHFQEI